MERIVEGAATLPTPRTASGSHVPAGTAAGVVNSDAEFRAWWADRLAAHTSSVATVPLTAMESWQFQPGTTNLRHVSGRFFSVEGIEVRAGSVGPPTWSQPIIHQPEIGILGIVVKEFDGVLHCLMQAKMEPGNINTLQLSPTVQATRSNYRQVHRGSGTRYLEYFLGSERGDLLVDVLQSEQGAWFWRKRNRNMVVQVHGDVPVHEDYCWLSLDQLYGHLHTDNLVNMDARTVLSCMTSLRSAQETAHRPNDAFQEALLRAHHPAEPTSRDHQPILTWLNEAKSLCEWSSRLVPLASVERWTVGDRISRDDDRLFQIVGVEVEARSREVHRWCQPLLRPRGQCLAVLVTRVRDGVLEVLVRATAEYGLMDQIEIGPSVCLGPGADVADIPHTALRNLMAGHGGRVLYDVLLSEEGGRFLHALTRYQIIEVGTDFPGDLAADYRWLPVTPLVDLIRHGHYFTIEARSLLACLHSLSRY